MTKIEKIHQGKQPVRRHYIAEWLEHRGLSAMDLLELLNDPDRSSEYAALDKSQVYRWIKGQLPQAAMQARIAAALGLPDPAKLLMPPEMDWMNEFFQDRSTEELSRMRAILEAAFPKKRDGTNG